ncbi:C-X-C chemokine receptor type 2-like [Pungitius pungitius]|uniref:C-X-C chemokine receptor type 2-like n=1 Tax=Pungitius pungitius TaxID=134920 RepID=UPI002E13AE3E
MSYIFNYEDLNLTSYDNLTPYIVDPKTLSCDLQRMPPAAAKILCVLLIIIFLLAIPGNLLVGWVVGTSKQALTPSDVYLFHLTISDFLMALTIPCSAVNLIQGWVFEDFLCKFLSLVFEANFYTSILFLTCISVDRYLMIVRASVSHRSRQWMCSRFLCATVWGLGLALALPALFNGVSEPRAAERIICGEIFDLGSATSWRTVIRGFRHILGFFLPLVVMVICYSVTITRLLRTRGFRKHRAMKVIIAVVTVFLLCWTPYHITIMVDTLLRADVIQHDCSVRTSVSGALTATHGLALFHSCINPVLYAFVGEKFRSKMMRLVRRRAGQERASGSRFSRSTSQTSEGNGALL